MKTISRLSNSFLQAHPQDAARVFEQLPAEQSATALCGCNPSIAAEVIRWMTPDTAAHCLDDMPADRSVPIIEGLPIDRAVRIALRWKAQTQEQMLNVLSPHTANLIRRMLQYPPGSVGSMMDPTGFCLPADISVGEARQRVHDAGQKVQFYLYIVDRDHKLVGVLNLRDFILASAGQPLASIMRLQVVKFKAGAVLEQVVSAPELKRFLAFPVVDGKGTFLGVLSTQTVYEAAEQKDLRRSLGGSVETVVAMGELYWVALSGMLAGGKPPRRPNGPAPQPAAEVSDGQ